MRLRANYPYTIRRPLHRHSCKISAKPWCCHGSPVTALALLCLVLHPESQQPISENKGTPEIRNSEKNNTRWISWNPLPIYFGPTENWLVLTESPVLADTNWLMRPFSWQKRWCLSDFTVLMCSRSTVDKTQRRREKNYKRQTDGFMRWLHSTLTGLTVKYQSINKKDNCLHLR